MKTISKRLQTGNLDGKNHSEFIHVPVQHFSALISIVLNLCYYGVHFLKSLLSKYGCKFHRYHHSSMIQQNHNSNEHSQRASQKLVWFEQSSTCG